MKRLRKLGFWLLASFIILVSAVLFLQRKGESGGQDQDRSAGVGDSPVENGGWAKEMGAGLAGDILGGGLSRNTLEIPALKEGAKTGSQENSVAQPPESTESSPVPEIENTERSGVSQSGSAESSPATQPGSQESAPALQPVTDAVRSSLDGYLRQSSLHARTDQVVAVVANGAAATVTLLEKNGDAWDTIITTSGFVGASGVGAAQEGVSRTPYGAYTLGFAFGQGGDPGTQLPYRQVTGNSYWISDINDPQYNTWQERGSSSPMDEHLIEYPWAYKYAITLNYDGGYGGGSAFFLHVSTGGPTAGCVSVPENVMLQFMQRIHPGAYIVNVNGEEEIGGL